MDKIEHLLTILSEECSEVAKNVCKSLRFGLDDKVTMNPEGPRGTEGLTNKEKIEEEFVDLLAIWDLLVEEVGFKGTFLTCDPETELAISKKKRKVEAYMEYAKRVGALK